MRRLIGMKRLLVAMVAMAVVVAACGDGGEATTTTAGDPGDTPVDSTSTAAIPPVAAEPVALLPTFGVGRAEVVETAPISELAAGLNNAGFELWRTQSTEGNLVFSPASIGHALLMVRAAADEATGVAIDQAFGLPDGLSAHQAWNATEQLIAAAAESEDEITITIADRIWPRLDLTPDQGWIDLLAAQHGATTETLDFLGDPDGSREVINSWVGDQTTGLIPELLPEGFIDPLTILVLTDAVYFKAQWRTPFGKYESVTDSFTRLDGSTTEVEYMRELELAERRGVGDGFVGAEIPYIGGEFSMLVIIPDEGEFPTIRDRLGQELLDEIDATFTTGPYELLIPKWETTTQLDLIAWLTEQDAAPGSYPLIAPGAFLDAAVHGADIVVDEVGTVAVAATGLAFAMSGGPDPDLVIKADRPFLYVIRHLPTGLVLFAGQVTDPNA